MDAKTGCFLELIRGDQCQFGLADYVTGFPHLKPTGFLTAPDTVKHELAKRCPGDHLHSPLEGGQWTKRAQVWPKRLCQAILKGFITELEERSLHAAFAGEFSAEVEHELLQPLGHFDAIYDDEDLAKNTAFDHKTSEAELQRLEPLEERQDLPDSSALESTRREKWLRANRSVRAALRRLHAMSGHCKC